MKFKWYNEKIVEFTKMYQLQYEKQFKIDSIIQFEKLQTNLDNNYTEKDIK